MSYSVSFIIPHLKYCIKWVLFSTKHGLNLSVKMIKPTVLSLRWHAPLSNLFFYSLLLPRRSIVSELESIVSVVCLLSSQPIL